MTDGERLAAKLRASGDYPAVRVLPDDSVAAVMPLITTTSVILGCTSWGYARRFCFKSPALALQRFVELQSEDDEPEGWIARRPK